MFPQLTTERLILRKVEQADAPVVLRGYGNPHVNQHMSVAYHTLYEVQAQLDWYEELFAKGDGMWWGICLKDEPEIMIGNGGFHAWKKQHGCIELGYWILPEYHGKGYATEAAKAMCSYAFETLGVHRIEASVEGENKASMQMLTKFGFTNEGARKECELKNGQYIDLYSFALFNPAHYTRFM